MIHHKPTIKDDVDDIIPLYQYVSNHISSHCISNARVEMMYTYIKDQYLPHIIALHK